MNDDSTGRNLVVSVYGSSMASAEDPSYRSALELGRALARCGADVACGGYGGVMEAVSRGAHESGGRAIGYTVDGWTMRTPNRFLAEDRPCSDLYERLQRLIEDSSALVALGGGIGTLVEVALAWNQLYMGLIDERPLIVVGSGWARAIDGLSGFLEISDAHLEHLVICEDTDAVVSHLRDCEILT